MKWFSYILVFLVFFLAIGTSVFFFFQLNQIKSSVNRELKNDEQENLLSFRFTQTEYNELNWLEKGKEFRMNGKMYDIASIQKTQNFITVFCAYDTQETRVRQVFANLLSGASSKSLPLRQLVKIIGQKYFSSALTGIFENTAIKKIKFKPYLYSLITGLIKPESPPPELPF